MFFHLVLTGDCNSQCRYCFGEAMDDVDGDFSELDIDYCLPSRISYDLKTLNRFCGQDSDCTLTFYGGEPLLRVDDVRSIMDSVKAKRFMLQTNGLLLHNLEFEYTNRFHTILVSVDGDEALTDFYRGNGTFRRVVDNLRLIRRNGFNGELIARMTVMEQTDILKQVKWLLSNREFPFSSVHWQLNAGFWKNDFDRRDFRRWGERNYNPGIRELARFWVDYMQSNGKVLRLYPFLGITQSFLSNEEKCNLRCGGGWINYAIQTDGHIIICPTMWGIKEHYVGHIGTSDPLTLKKVAFREPCTECGVFSACGGRCLYANITKRWSPEAYSLVCETVRNLIRALHAELPRIRRLIDQRRIRSEDFEYNKYNGCEIIP